MARLSVGEASGMGGALVAFLEAAAITFTIGLSAAFVIRSYRDHQSLWSLLERRTRMRARFERYEYMIHRYEERLALECAETLLELSTRRYEIESQLDEVERHLELQSAENLRQAHAQLFILEQQTFLPSNSFDDDARSSGAAVVELDRSAKMPGAPYKRELELDSLLREVELASRAVRGSAGWKSGTSTLRKLTAIKRA